MKYKLTASCIAFLFTLSACATYSNPAMQRFVENMDMAVEKGGSINPYLESPAMTIQGIREAREGVMEYSFVQTSRSYIEPELRCKFAFLVKKGTDKITGWKYVDKPEYCLHGQ